jgi:hypothetical protein
VAFVRSLPDHALLDRVIRGRVWIPLLGVLLAGIVGMQVEVLKLGASMGRSLERSTALQSRNELLQASVATLADDRRIERLAAGMGMVMPAPDAVDFLAARPVADVQPAIAGIHQPDASAFTAQLPVAGSAGTSTPTTTPVVSADRSGATNSAGGTAATSTDATPASSTNNGELTPTAASSTNASAATPTAASSTNDSSVTPSGG